MFSARSQKALVWWALVLTTIYALAFGLLLHMIPPPTAKWSPIEIAHFYAVHHTSIKVGAAIAGWTSGFFVPLSIVVAMQMARHEIGKPVWSVLTAAGGTMMSIFLVLPPLFLGVAAFSPGRSPEVTSIMHELGILTFVTTDQYVIFMWVAVVVICFAPNRPAHSPFPRWFGYLTAWTLLLFETTPLAFLFRGGLFAWNGLLTYWTGLVAFGVWIGAAAWLLFRSINAQIEEERVGALQQNVASVA